MFEDVTFKEWEEIPSIYKVIESENPRRFAKTRIAGLLYGISWDEDLIPPTRVEMSNANLTLIAIGSKAVGICNLSGSIAFSIGLYDRFSFFEYDDANITIVSETTVIILNVFGFSINRHLIAPDIINNIEVRADGYYANCIDGSYKIG